MHPEGSVRLGVERLLDSGPDGLSGYGSAPRIGFLTHDGAGVRAGESMAGSPPPSRTRETATRISSRAALMEAGFNLARLFSPEHGITAAAPDGHAVSDVVDGETGLPVVSLYGPDLAPAPGQLAGLDLVLVDLQDVGARFYTYVWTVSHLLEAAGQAGVPVMILDRPNPVGGDLSQAEGPIMDPEEANFLGRWPVPIRHSLTLGEFAGVLRGEMGLDTAVEVTAMAGWDRTMLWPDTGLPFIPPSPGIPTWEATLTYPALAFLEATNLHVGRGTDRAFRWFGAPWLDGPGVVRALNGFGIPGLLAKEDFLFGKDASDAIPGVSLQVTDPSIFRPVAAGLRILALLATFGTEQFRWADYPTAVNPTGANHLARLLGRRDMADALRTHPESVTDSDVATWCRAPGWHDRVRPYLLYP